MLANYGRIGGKRVMSELAVRVGTGNLLPDGVAGPAMMGPASHFGAGGRVGIGAGKRHLWLGRGGGNRRHGRHVRRGIRSSIFVQFMPPNANALLPEYQRALQADVPRAGGCGMSGAQVAFAGSRIDRADHVRQSPEAWPG